MKQKQVSGRELRHGNPEESLAPGESILIKKRGGKVFELKRIDAGPKSMLQRLDRLMSEMPSNGPASISDLSRIIIEGRG